MVLSFLSLLIVKGKRLHFSDLPSSIEEKIVFIRRFNPKYIYGFRNIFLEGNFLTLLFYYNKNPGEFVFSYNLPILNREITLPFIKYLIKKVPFSQNFSCFLTSILAGKAFYGDFSSIKYIIRKIKERTPTFFTCLGCWGYKNFPIFENTILSFISRKKDFKIMDFLLEEINPSSEQKEMIFSYIFDNKKIKNDRNRELLSNYFLSYGISPFESNDINIISSLIKEGNFNLIKYFLEYNFNDSKFRLDREQIRKLLQKSRYVGEMEIYNYLQSYLYRLVKLGIGYPEIIGFGVFDEI